MGPNCALPILGFPRGTKKICSCVQGTGIASSPPHASPSLSLSAGRGLTSPSMRALLAMVSPDDDESGEGRKERRKHGKSFFRADFAVAAQVFVLFRIQIFQTEPFLLLLSLPRSSERRRAPKRAPLVRLTGVEWCTLLLLLHYRMLSRTLAPPPPCQTHTKRPRYLASLLSFRPSACAQVLFEKESPSHQVSVYAKNCTLCIPLNDPCMSRNIPHSCNRERR